MNPGFARIGLVLGLLALVGPFAIDMYLPALPAIGADLRASTATVQLTLTAYFVSFGLAQIFYGPLSDKFGRKPPMTFGLICFIIGSIGCYTAPDIGTLIAFRAVQGAGASALMVITRAVIRDLHTGVAAARLMSIVLLVFGISPMLAPAVGGTWIAIAGWRSIFALVGLAATAALVIMTLFLPETRDPRDRVGVSFSSVAIGFAAILRSRRFLGLSFVGGLGSSSFFAFLANSPFIYIEHFGLTPTMYGLMFSLNAVGYFAAVQIAPRIARRYGLQRVLLGGVAGHATLALTLLGVTASGVDDMVILTGLLFATLTFLGLVTPTAMVLALDPHGTAPGLASSLAGTIQMFTGGVAIVINGLVFDGTVLPMAAILAGCASLNFSLAYITLRREVAAASP